LILSVFNWLIIADNWFSMILTASTTLDLAASIGARTTFFFFRDLVSEFCCLSAHCHRDRHRLVVGHFMPHCLIRHLVDLGPELKKRADHRRCIDFGDGLRLARFAVIHLSPPIG
jgi:hypothetical protein